MRAAVVVGHGALDKIEYCENLPVPEISRNDLLIKVRATALNYHDIFTRRGMPGIKIPFPIITGSDIAGEVEAIGPDAKGWTVGDRVLINPIFHDDRTVGLLGEITNGGKAEFVVARDYQLIRLDDRVSYEDAASLPLAYGTAHRMMVTIGKVMKGETVLILGASGGVGVACVQLAKMAGATVIACASTDEKIEKLKALGADHCINYKMQDMQKSVYEIVGKPRISGKGGVDIAVNFTGGDTWKSSIRCTKKGGRILTCGATAGFDVEMDLRYVWTFEHQILGSNGWMTEDLNALLGLIEEGSLKPVIDCILPLEQVTEAERRMEDREFFGKILIQP